MLYLLSEEKSRKSRILDETFWKSLEYRRDFYFRENVIPYLAVFIKYFSKHEGFLAFYLPIISKSSS